MSKFLNPKLGSLVGIPFSITNATTGNSNTDLLLKDGSLFRAPTTGSVVGLSVQANAAITAGTAIFRTHAAGTEHTEAVAPAVTLSSAAAGGQSLVSAGSIRFAAGDTLGISVTTTTTLAPTNTLDVDAVLFVMLDGV